MDKDTHIGGANRDFPNTRISVVSRARGPSEADRDRARATLIEDYWKPIYTYIRLRWSASNEDAKDLTQSFLASTLESTFFDRFDASRARFRTYLRVCVDGYVTNEFKGRARAKRGGHAEHISIDGADHAPTSDDPESLFFQEWVRNLFALAVQDLKHHCEQAEKQDCFLLFERYHLDPPEGEKLTYARLAAAMSIPETQVTNFLAYARRHFRSLLLERIREATGSDEEFRAEVRAIIGAVP